MIKGRVSRIRADNFLVDSEDLSALATAIGEALYASPLLASLVITPY